MELYSLIDFTPVTWISTILLIFLLYKYGMSSYDFWEKQGVPGPKPHPFLGNIIQDINKVMPLQDIIRRKRYGRVYGLYDGRNPALHISEPALLREVLVKSFNVFVNRRSFNISNEDPAVQEIIIMKNGEDWKRARSVLTPTLTSGKLKQMIPLIEDCIKPLIDLLDKKATSKTSIEMKELLTPVIYDVIATCAFGFKVDGLNNPDAPFMTHANNLIKNQKMSKLILLILMPRLLLKMLPIKLRFLDNNAVQYFKKVINGIIKERKDRNIHRPDFLQSMLDAQIQADDPEAKATSNKTKTTEDNDAETRANIKKVLTPDGVVGQSIVFLLAGSDGMSTIVGAVCYLLAKHPEVQERLYQEIEDTLKKNDGKLNYDIIFGMDYLEMVLSEGLRMFSAGARIERVAMEDFKLGNIFVKKGATIVVPIYSMHMDEELYPDPEKFDPERFSPENKSSIDQYAYMPFGAGPRNCIGMRFALMETKMLLIRLTEKFVFCKGPEFEENIKLSKNAPIVFPANGFWMRVEKRNA